MPLWVPEPPGKVCERIELRSIACFWEQEQENNINRLVADSREVNRVAQTGWRYSRRDDDLSRHFRMDRAEIFDRACRRKRLRKLIIGIEGA
jgi:hypothetical protein